MAFLLPVFAAVGSAIGSVFTGGAAAAGAAGAAGAAAAGGGFSLGTALTVGSTLLGVAGTLAQGQAAKNAAEYNAKVQEQQAEITNQQAGAKATEIAQRTRQKMSGVRAASIESGLELSGSVNDVLDTVQTQGTLDAMTAIYDGTTRAQGLRNSAALERSKGKSAVTASYLGAGSSLLTGFSKAYTV
jgi:hypothetical protein